MARLNPQPVSSDTDSQRLASSPNPDTPATSDTPPSPSLSSSSDKENGHRRSTGKRKGATAPMADRAAVSSPKRRRVDAAPAQGQAAQQFYDPNQNPEERRQVRKGLRNLFSKLHDSRSEFLQPNSKGLQETLREADALYKNVKQTAEATIDSRLLVETADLSYRKINNLTLGDASTGIDVDDFISKCIGFMKQGDDLGRQDRNDPPPSTQTQRRRRQGGDADEEDEGDTMNWNYLGRNACFLYNSRPCLTGFLLGPLSVQKKVRQQTQRKAREAPTDATQAVRPVELRDEDLEKQESANLTEVCTEIARLLSHTLSTGTANVEREFDEGGEDMSDEQVREILHRHSVADNGCVPLFNFCINPKSFGQSVENLFYVSFLIKEGKVGLDFDGNGLPTLGIAAVRSVAERQETQRNQAVFTLDFDVWEDIVKTFGIEKSIIPHRADEEYDDGILDYAQMENDAVRVEEEEEDSDAYA